MSDLCVQPQVALQPASAGAQQHETSIGKGTLTQYLPAGPESLEVALFDWDQIPWSDIAFPTVHWALNAWNECRSGALGMPAGNPVSVARRHSPCDSPAVIRRKVMGRLAYCRAPACPVSVSFDVFDQAGAARVAQLFR